MPESPGQTQSQTQSLQLTLNLGQNSGDPELERRVLNELYSAGSQLGRVADVLELLIRAAEGSPALQSHEAELALAAFREMRSKIAELKLARSPEQRFIAELDALKLRDRAQYDRTREVLHRYLDEP